MCVENVRGAREIKITADELNGKVHDAKADVRRTISWPISSANKIGQQKSAVSRAKIGRI